MVGWLTIKCLIQLKTAVNEGSRLGEASCRSFPVRKGVMTLLKNSLTMELNKVKDDAKEVPVTVLVPISIVFRL